MVIASNLSWKIPELMWLFFGDEIFLQKLRNITPASCGCAVRIEKPCAIEVIRVGTRVIAWRHKFDGPHCGLDKYGNSDPPDHLLVD